ncbi:App1 family protein [Cognatilysobacter segetis]|uniref:App1 family protein n=1 Tax=Cognatilysobacter segetis TaxID=2492394 RepID=UPI00105C169D|nr:phosphatase domain-containing protein [Lysobacter segetis]
MTNAPAPPPRRPLLAALSRLEDGIDAVRDRLLPRRPGHIAAYRGWGDDARVDLIGRVLADAPQGGPGENDSRWRNLRHSVQRFTTDEVRRQALRLRLDAHDALAVTDGEGYYAATLPGMRAPDGLWGAATVSLDDGRLETPQPVLYVHADAGVGVISDIDDTVLDSSITDWKTAAQLTFLHNARTRKPLVGAALLYQALQQGMDGRGRVPVFYVSSSPWNLYDLLEEFMALNGLPPGPMCLRDLGLDAGMFIKSPGHGHKLERARQLIARFPRLRWVLLGDSGQADAELYAEAAHEFGERIAAIYIRDVDPDRDSPLDTAVDAQIARVAGTRVPMLRTRDSRAIADHAASIGLIRPDWLGPIEREVMRDAGRPTLAEAATEAAVAGERGPDAPVG